MIPGGWVKRRMNASSENLCQVKRLEPWAANALESSKYTTSSQVKHQPITREMRHLLSCVKWSTSVIKSVSGPRPLCRHCSSSGSAVRLQCDDYNDNTDPSLCPLVISHGMLGSRHNWTSIAKQLHKSTGGQNCQAIHHCNGYLLQEDG